MDRNGKASPSVLALNGRLALEPDPRHVPDALAGGLWQEEILFRTTRAFASKCTSWEPCGWGSSTDFTDGSNNQIDTFNL